MTFYFCLQLLCIWPDVCIEMQPLITIMKVSTVHISTIINESIKIRLENKSNNGIEIDINLKKDWSIFDFMSLHTFIYNCI